MSADSIFDFGTPYDLMTGLWNGMSTLYNAKGEYQFSTPSLVSIYWKQRPNLLSFRQIEVVDPLKFPRPEHSPRVKSLPESSLAEHSLYADALNINDFHFDLD